MYRTGIIILFILLPFAGFSQTKESGSYYMANGDTAILLTKLGNISGYLYTVEFNFLGTDSIFSVDFGSSLFNISGSYNYWEFNSHNLDSLPYVIDPIDYPTKRKSIVSYAPFPYPTFQIKINTTPGDSSTIDYKVNFFKQ